jgi:hypothetical protein
MEDKVYTPLRLRTVTLVKRSVDMMRRARERISLASVSAKSKELDSEHRGISESAILNNKEARTYYEQYRTWQGDRKRRTKPFQTTVSQRPGQVKLNRDEERVRQRYMRMSKEELVTRLITVERIWAEQKGRWLSQQDEVLTWRLRAEGAEARLTQEVDRLDIQ